MTGGNGRVNEIRKNIRMMLQFRRLLFLLLILFQSYNALLITESVSGSSQQGDTYVFHIRKKGAKGLKSFSLM